MGWFSRALLTGAAIAMASVGVAAAEKEAFETSSPHKMVRALQLIQDQVVAGDRSANEMQRFLLTTIDERLRNIDMKVFEDPRNVDAALIYAMSGGNPETLDLLADRDVSGNFDNRVTSIIRRYLKGQGEAVIEQLQAVVPEYRNTAIGPYIELIGANAVMGKQPDVAIRFFDWARLESPGTIIEEAAIRRSLALMSKNGNIEKALLYAKLYARRFMVSPYASQFADIFVMMAIDHTDLVHMDDIEVVLALMEQGRQREIYLRLARRAAINGNRELANFSARNATRLSSPEDRSQRALAELYSGLVNIPTDGVEKVLVRFSAIQDKDLSPKDRFLKDAARIVAEEVAKPPGEESLTQVRRDMVEKEYRDRMAERIRNAKPLVQPTTTVQSDGTKATADLENFVSAGRSKLKEIDAMLTSESK